MNKSAFDEYVELLEGEVLTREHVERLKELAGEVRTRALDVVLEELVGCEVDGCEKALIRLSLEGADGMKEFVEMCREFYDGEEVSCGYVKLAERLSEEG